MKLAGTDSMIIKTAEEEKKERQQEFGRLCAIAGNQQLNIEILKAQLADTNQKLSMVLQAINGTPTPPSL